MIQSQYQKLVMQWHALQAFLTQARDDEEGIATLEVVIITAGLAVLAAAILVVIRTAVGNHTANIS